MTPKIKDYDLDRGVTASEDTPCEDRHYGISFSGAHYIVPARAIINGEEIEDTGIIIPSTAFRLTKYDEPDLTAEVVEVRSPSLLRKIGEMLQRDARERGLEEYYPSQGLDSIRYGLD
jgi:hypothetical protein